MRRTPTPAPDSEHAHFRRGARRRLLGAAGLAALLLLLGILVGPDREDIKRRFEISGREGPLKVMPELSIDEGLDARHQEELRKALQPPAPAPDYVVEEEDPDAEQERPVPAPPVPEPGPETVPVLDADLDDADAVEMRLPSQTNPWFRLIRMVRPRYPADATDAERALPSLTVEVAFFVAPTGEVQGAYILSNEGGPAFADVVLRAVEQWLYEPVPGAQAPSGFWNRLTLTFKAPLLVR